MVEIGILGGGLAGILLANALQERGGRAFIGHEEHSHAASPMAPGIINPLAGRKYRPNRDLAENEGLIRQTFQQFEVRLDAKLWHPTKLIRILEDAKQRKSLQELEDSSDQGPWLGEVFSSEAHRPAFKSPFGSFETLRAGWLDVPELITRARSSDQFTFLKPRALEENFETVVDCRGWRCSLDEAWRSLPWKCARGEVARIHFSDTSPDRHLWNGGGWLQPLPDGSWRTGATYSWDQFEAPPQTEALQALEAKVRRWVDLPFELSDPQVGIRPIVQDFKPVIGSLPHNPRRYIFSALGSHGAIFGPPGANALADHLLFGKDLRSDWDVKRFV